MKEAHPPARTLAMVRTGASKIEIIGPAKCGNRMCKSLTHAKRSRQFGIDSPISPAKRANRTNAVPVRDSSGSRYIGYFGG